MDSLDTLESPELITVISPNGSVCTVQKTCIFPMSAFSSLLPLDCYSGGESRPIDLRKSDPGFPIPDEFITLSCEFLNVRNGVDLYVVKPGEKFGFDRKNHDIMNPLYISDCWMDSIKGRNEWLAKLGERFVPDPVVDASIPAKIRGVDGKEIPNPDYVKMYEEALGPAFQHGMRMVKVADWFGVNGISHLVCARVKFITRSYLGKKAEWHAFCEKYKPGIENWPRRVAPPDVS